MFTKTKLTTPLKSVLTGTYEEQTWNKHFNDKYWNKHCSYKLKLQIKKHYARLPISGNIWNQMQSIFLQTECDQAPFENQLFKKLSFVFYALYINNLDNI